MLNYFFCGGTCYLVDGELGPEVGLRPQVLHVFLNDIFHPQLFQAVGDIIERILIWKNCQGLSGWGEGNSGRWESGVRRRTRGYRGNHRF